MAAEANGITLAEVIARAQGWRGFKSEYAGAKKLTRQQCKNRLHEAIQLARFNGICLDELFRELDSESTKDVPF
jgi:hypothetical protein